ncbi:tectonin domain-containing protein [Bacillus thuringiensis]|uniref:tectonin domain-containing protein n=1 Tax=Bacillus thuringiensis TaxID=1428 RepID=UPI000BFE1035|nr:tectonin domain-containing protein [Bacillus thuringiensis]PGK33921.1 hypothetical protein CN908_28920 [Bacillus thuringiensis]
MTITNTIAASTPDTKSVFVYTGGTSWRQVATASQVGAYRELHGGGAGLVVAFGPNRAIFLHIGNGNWRNLTPTDPPGTGSIALTAEGIYAVLNARVLRHNGITSTSWTEIGSNARELYGGRYGLVATDPTTGSLFRYLGSPHNWQHIGGPGAMFAVTADSVYGLNPNKSGVFRYNGTGTNWTQIGNAAGEIYGGAWGLVATNPTNGNLFRYLGSPHNWQYIGGPGAMFTVTDDTVFGLTPDRGAVYRYDGTGSSWTKVGGPAHQIVAIGWA